MRTKSLPTIGLIAEDSSDIYSAKEIINRLKGRKIGTKHYVGEGCGKIKRKCNAWANLLKDRGCSVLILIHDLDNNNQPELIKKIKESLGDCPISRHLICIPIQEIEAWYLADETAIAKTLRLKKVPKAFGKPEQIDSPKEKIEEIVYKYSNGEKRFLHVKHNPVIAKNIDINKVSSKCPSFKKLVDFVRNDFNMQIA